MCKNSILMNTAMKVGSKKTYINTQAVRKKQQLLAQ